MCRGKGTCRGKGMCRGKGQDNMGSSRAKDEWEEQGRSRGKGRARGRGRALSAITLFSSYCLPSIGLCDVDVISSRGHTQCDQRVHQQAVTNGIWGVCVQIVCIDGTPCGR